MCRYMRLDTAAALALNVEAAPGENEAYSLVGVLNHCRTPQGQRLLKQWIKQPLIDLRHIGKEEGEREGGREGGRGGSGKMRRLEVQNGKGEQDKEEREKGGEVDSCTRSKRGMHDEVKYLCNLVLSSFKNYV